MEGWQQVVVFAVTFGIFFGFVWSIMRRRFKDRS